ncbi:hypothetical protein M2156_007379 [Streptomyces sp. SAI-149]|jgi:hypothetical protein|nr:hypothetical protein [Streptomyces sp. SAI-119]MDH6501160.1 hypothetical protein [Streptomyces sp. SAI-149]
MHTEGAVQRLHDRVRLNRVTGTNRAPVPQGTGPAIPGKDPRT